MPFEFSFSAPETFITKTVAIALAAAIPVAAAALPAQAAAVTDGDYIPLSGILSPGGTVSWSFEPDQPLLFDLNITVSGRQSDLEQLTLAYNGMTTGFTSFVTDPSGADASSLILPDFAAESPFTISLYDADLSSALSEEVSIAGTLQAAPAPVPVPAAMPLMAAGLGALGFLRCRRRRAAA